MAHRFWNFLIRNQVLFALFILIAGWILIQIRDILLSVFLSYIIMAAVLPYVIFLRKKNFPKLLAVALPYFTILGAILIIILPLVSFVIDQIQTLITKFPNILKEAINTLDLSLDSSQIQSYIANELKNISTNAFTLTSKVFGGLFSLMMILIVSFYLLLYYDEFKKLIARLFRLEKRPYVLSTLDIINEKLGAWLRGQVMLSVFIGLMSWVTLIALGVPDPVPLALLASLLEVVPTLGPILSAIPAVIVALTISPTLALTVIIAYIAIQLLENNFLVPKIMERAVGLNPIVIILAVIIGANLMGISGALLAIPLVTFIIVIFKSIDHKKSD